MKSIEDHVKKFVFNVGKFKDEKLTNVTDLEYLDWFVNSEYASPWQKKLVNWYVDDIAKSIMDKTNAEKEIEDKENAKIQEELKNGMWVDENF